MATLSEKFEEFCTSLKADPPSWVRAEIDGAAGEVARQLAEAEAAGEEGLSAPVDLDLRGNCLPERFSARLTSADCFPVAEALRNDAYITSLDLGFNRLDDSGAAAVARLLGQNGALLNVNLEYNEVGGEGGKATAEALPKCTSLRQLVLRGNAMEDTAGVPIAHAINASSLELLDVSSCELGLPSLVAMCMACESSDSKLSHLYMSNMRMRHNEAQKGVALGRMLKLNNSLVCLDISKLQLSNDDVGYLVKGLNENSTLKSLSLAGNKLAWQGSTLLANYLRENATLEELDVSANELHDNGAFAFRETLIMNSTLLYLNLSNCGIKDEGLLAIAEGLSANQSLEALHLWGNHFGQPSGQLFMSVAHQREDLRTDFLPYEVDGQILIARS